MHIRFSDIKDTKIFASGDAALNPIGIVDDLLIEDGSWNVRYLAVTTNVPLTRRVLLSPVAIDRFDHASKSIATTLTAQQVVDSPPLNCDQPISRQYEEALVDYFGWPIYWFGRTILKPQTLEAMAASDAMSSVDETSCTNLRSAAEICGYQIQTHNGVAGVMNDLVIQLDAWTVDFATADSKSWLPSESSMFSTNWIRQIDWYSQNVAIDLSKSALEPVTGRDQQPAITGEPLSARPFRTI